jgi:hypothetical protein
MEKNYSSKMKDARAARAREQAFAAAGAAEFFWPCPSLTMARDMHPTVICSTVKGQALPIIRTMIQAFLQHAEN